MTAFDRIYLHVTPRLTQLGITTQLFLPRWQYHYLWRAGVEHDLRMVGTGVAKHCQYCKHIRESNPTTNPSHEPNAVYVSH